MVANRRFLAFLKYSQGILITGNRAASFLGITPARVQATSDTRNGPNLLTPADRVNISTVTPILSWSAVPEASYYIIEISKDPNFGTLDIPSATRFVTSYTPPALGGLKYGVTYYWRVTAYNDNWTSLASIPRRFTITIQKLPADGAFTTVTTPIFSWSTVPGAINYDIYLSKTLPWILTLPNPNQPSAPHQLIIPPC